MPALAKGGRGAGPNSGGGAGGICIGARGGRRRPAPAKGGEEPGLAAGCAWRGGRSTLAPACGGRGSGGGGGGGGMRTEGRRIRAGASLWM